MNSNEGNKVNRRIEDNDNNIVLQILSIANGGASESEIKSKITNLRSSDNDKLLTEYLKHLIKSGFIGYDDTDPHVYKTTEEGLRFLESYERIETGTDHHEPPKGMFHIG
jgi:predicted transcriptional regulator